jgi:hypothetical protein
VLAKAAAFATLVDEEELATKPRRDTTPITKAKVYARHTNPGSTSSTS